MKKLKECIMCRRLKWFNVPKNEEELSRDWRYTTCQFCRNLVTRMRQRERRMGMVDKSTEEYIEYVKAIEKKVE